MVPFTLRSLLHDRVRLLISVSGVAAAVVLVLVLRGIMDGTIDKATWYVERVEADVFVTQAGVQNMSLSTPVLPASLEDVVAGLPGVAAARGIVRVPSLIQAGDAEVPSSIVGFDPRDGIGGPWRMHSGTTEVGPDGVVVDVEFARQHGLALGDLVRVANGGFRIVGLARETNALATGRVVFIHRDAAERLFLLTGAVNWILVRAEPGVDPAVLASQITASAEGISALTREALLQHDRDLFGELFGLPVNVMATIGYAVGLMVLGLATYGAASERTRDFGVLKAIGARDRFLYRTVLQIAFAITAAGFTLGVLLAFAAAPLVTAYAPELGVTYRLDFVLQTLAVATALALVAAVVPVRRLAGLDPREVLS